MRDTTVKATTPEKWRLSLTLLLAIWMVSMVSACATPSDRLRRSPTLIREGDQVTLDYTCRFDSGEIIATTREAVKSDPQLTKSDWLFYRRDAVTLTAGQALEIAPDNLREFYPVLYYHLAQAVIDKPPATRQSVDIQAQPSVGVSPGIAEMPATRAGRFEKIVVKTYDEVEDRIGRIPEEGEIIQEMNGQVEIEILAVKDREVRYEQRVADGTKQRFREGMATVYDQGDHYTWELDAGVGDVFRTGPFLGRVDRLEEKRLFVDFGHPFGYRKLSCDVIIHDVGKEKRRADRVAP